MATASSAKNEDTTASFMELAKYAWVGTWGSFVASFVAARFNDVSQTACSATHSATVPNSVLPGLDASDVCAEEAMQLPVLPVWIPMILGIITIGLVLASIASRLATRPRGSGAPRTPQPPRTQPPVAGPDGWTAARLDPPAPQPPTTPAGAPAPAHKLQWGAITHEERLYSITGIVVAVIGLFLQIQSKS